MLVTRKLSFFQKATEIIYDVILCGAGCSRGGESIARGWVSPRNRRMKKGDDARKKKRWNSGNEEMKIEEMLLKQEKVQGRR